MPASTSLVFDDFDAYVAAIRAGASMGLLATDGGRFEAQLARLDLPGLWLLAGHERLRRIVFLDMPWTTLLIALPTLPRAALLWGGVPVGSDELLIVGPGSAVHARVAGPCRWGEIRISVPMLARYGRAMKGRSFRIPRSVCLWRPPKPALEVLVRLHNVAIKRTQSRPEMPLPSEAKHGLEQELIEAVIDCLADGVPDQSARQSDLMVRFERLCQIKRARALRLAEVAAVLGLSGRTLRAQCQTHLGMGPHAYLQLHRLHRAQRSLRNALPASTIMQIARAHGFTELGRFASSYRAVFGELPSMTLRKSAE